MSVRPAYWQAKSPVVSALLSGGVKLTVSTVYRYKCLLAILATFFAIHRNTSIFAFSVMRICVA